MKDYKSPKWWNREYDSAWDRVKDAFARDWEQTKHDFGGDAADQGQGVTDTIKQAAGKQTAPPPTYVATYEEAEPAYRFGYGARQYYGKQYQTWNDDLDSRLQEDWEATYPGERNAWTQYQPIVRRAWEHDKS